MNRPTGQVCCAAEGCREPLLERFRWYCKGHYYSLPPALRGQLWATWKAAMACYRQPVPHDEQLRRNRAYQAAFQAAQDHLRGVRVTQASIMTTVAHEAGQHVTFVHGRRM